MMTDTISKTLRTVWTACTLASLLVGCDGRKDVTTDFRPSKANQHVPQSIRSTADLRRLLIPAMGTNEIAAVLGKPRWVESLGNGEQVWHYSLPAFPADDGMQGSYVVGVAVAITNEHLANWGCSYVGARSDGISPDQDVLPGGKGLADSPKIQLFIVSCDPISDGRFIDTERFPKLGFIQPTPNLAISRVKEVTLQERTPAGSDNQSHAVWSFGIFLTQEDAARLKSMTATNASRKVLIMVGDEPVSAPTVVTPLETGTLVIECSDRRLTESVKKQLARMERQIQ
jgi:hypothetical protein